MSQHEDLFEAAIKAIDAVSAKNAANNPPAPPPEDDALDVSFDSQSDLFDIGNIMDGDDSLDGDNSDGEDVDLNLEFSIPAFQNSSTGNNPLIDDKNAMTSPAASKFKSGGVTGGSSIDYQSFVSRIDRLESTLEIREAELAKARQDLQTLTEEKEKLMQSEKALNERVVRLSADFDNYRKRVVRDQELTRNQLEERIVVSFLTVMDNFERAIAHAKQSSDYDQLMRGVELTSRMYLSTLAKHGCVPFDSVGKTFDPVYHDVLQRVINPEEEDNVIVQEHLKGYIMHERVVRPALVVVSQQSESGENNGENTDVEKS